jgi:hypothetical protein
MTTRAKVAMGLVAAGLTAFLVTIAVTGSGGTHETDTLMGVYTGAGMEGYMADLPGTTRLATLAERQAYAQEIAEVDQAVAITTYVKPVADDWSRMLPWLLLMGGVAAAGTVLGAAHLRREQGFGVIAELPFTRQL